MDLRAEKLKLIELLLHTDNPNIIQRIKSIFKSEETQDIWEELSDKQQQEIEKALDEVNKKETIAFETYIDKHKS